MQTGLGANLAAAVTPAAVSTALATATVTATGGTTARTLPAKASDLLTARDLGLVGDAATDNSTVYTAMSSARPLIRGVNGDSYALAAFARLRDRSYYGDGSTIVSSQVADSVSWILHTLNVAASFRVIKDTTYDVGAGLRGTAINCQLDAENNLRIQNCHFKSQRLVINKTDLTTNGAAILGVHIDRCQFTGDYGVLDSLQDYSAIDCRGAKYVLITNCTFDLAGIDRAIKLSNQCECIIFTGNIFRGTYLKQIIDLFTATRRMIIYGNILDITSSLSTLIDCKADTLQSVTSEPNDIIIANNHIQAASIPTGEMMLYLAGSWGLASATEVRSRAQVVGNKFLLTGDIACTPLEVLGLTDVHVADNIVDRVAHTGSVNIDVASCQRALVSRNTCYGGVIQVRSGASSKGGQSYGNSSEVADVVGNRVIDYYGATLAGIDFNAITAGKRFVAYDNYIKAEQSAGTSIGLIAWRTVVADYCAERGNSGLKNGGANTVQSSTTVTNWDFGPSQWGNLLDFLGGNFGDQSITYTPGLTSSPKRLKYSGTNLTANRTVTLTTTGGRAGDEVWVGRDATCGGTFTLAVGAASIKLPPGEYCIMHYNGSSYVMKAQGFLAGGPPISADFGDAAATVVVGTLPRILLWNTAITADRAVTLSTTGAVNGDWWQIVRGPSASGSFNLNVGTGPLRALASINTSCYVRYNGTLWVAG